MPNGKQEQRERGFKSSETAVLLIAADVLGILCILVIVAGNLDMLRLRLRVGEEVVAGIGAALILCRVILLTVLAGSGLVLTFVKILDGQKGGSTGLSEGSEATGVNSLNGNVWYKFAILLGLGGYVCIVVVTGGAVESPVSPYLVAAFFLGMIRANTRRSIHYLFISATVVIILTEVVAWRINTAVTFEPSWTVFSMTIVGLVTYLVNLGSFKPKGT